jgi:hypothetical protein
MPDKPREDDPQKDEDAHVKDVKKRSGAKVARWTSVR